MTDKKSIFNRIAEVVAQTANIDIEKVTAESSFEKLGLDSLDALAVINDLEHELKIKIPNAEVLKIRTVGQAAESFAKQLA